MNLNQSLLIRPFLVFFIIQAMQVGVGILYFTKDIAEAAGYQSWIAIIATGLIFHLLIWMIYVLLDDQHSDIVDINRFIFGKYISFIPTILLIIYYILATVSILWVYISVVQIWMFPEIPTIFLSGVLLSIVYYAVSRGFRTLVGLCLFGVVTPSFLLIAAFYLIKYSTLRSIFPLFDTSIYDQIKAIKEMTYSFFGISHLLVFYPFIQEAKKSQKFAHMANAATTLIYLYVAFFTFAFFAEEQIKEVMFPTLTSWKVVNVPFIERFEYVGIAIWLFTILPNITLTFWGASRLMKRQFNVSHRKTLIVVIVIGFIITLLASLNKSMEFLTTIASQYGMYVNYVYIPLLFVIILIKRRMKK